MDTQDGPLSFQDFWEQELQREADNPTYLCFLGSSLIAYHKQQAPRRSSNVDKRSYQEWCLQVNPKRFHKFKSNIVNKNGVIWRVVCKDWVFYEKATSKIILPHVLALYVAPPSKLGATLGAIQSRTDLTEEQKEAQSLEVFKNELDANLTGNHYRNHYIRASNPYGHD